MPSTRHGRRLSVQRHETLRLRSVSARLANAVSARLRPLRPLVPGALRVTRRTLLVTAASTPLAMLCAALLTTGPARDVLATWAPAQRLDAQAAPARVAATTAAPVTAGASPLPPRAHSAPRAGDPDPGVLLARDQLIAPLPAGPARRALPSEAEAQRLGGAVLAVGSASGRVHALAQLPLVLRALDQTWEELQLELRLPAGVRYLSTERGRGLHESGAELRVESHDEALRVTLTRTPESDPVPDGPLARLILHVDAERASALSVTCTVARRDGRPSAEVPSPGRLILE
jgi:hypothetical protein